MNVDSTYCRLCAESKPSNTLFNLQSNNAKRSEIIEKLVRINATTDFDDDILPKTVCFDCIRALNKAFEFVVAIEFAQLALHQIFDVTVVKKEKIEPDEILHEDTKGQEIYNSLPRAKDHLQFDVKKESDDDDIDRCSIGSHQKSVDRETPPRKVSKKSRKLDVDSIPLSELSQLKLTWNNYSWYCTYCETLFPNIDELTKHSMECHKICNPYRCTDCKIRKLRLDRFLIHVQKHHNYLRYSCFRCFEQFETAADTRKHTKSHLSTKFICSGCNTPFPNNDELKKHIDEYHLSKRARRIPKVLQTDGTTCKICQKVFKSKSGLNSHVIIHTERKKEHTCEVCGKGFFLKYNLAAHMVMHKDDRPHKCLICNFAFKTARLLKSHVGVHNSAKPHSCSQCGRCFRLKKQLQSHSIIHTDVHPYACPHCQKRFRFKTILNNHVRLHTGVRPYSCEPCQRDFTNWSNYNKHMKRKHNMDTSKKKHTPDGVYPIDPNTGTVIVKPETNKMIEWKKMMMVNRGLGRPPKVTVENVDTSATLLPL